MGKLLVKSTGVGGSSNVAINYSGYILSKPPACYRYIMVLSLDQMNIKF